MKKTQIDDRRLNIRYGPSNHRFNIIGPGDDDYGRDKWKEEEFKKWLTTYFVKIKYTHNTEHEPR